VVDNESEMRTMPPPPASIEALAVAINSYMAASTVGEQEAAKAIARQYRAIINDSDAFSDALEYARVIREATTT
jgi:hypothetical protein